MNAVSKVEKTADEKPTGLALMREPFPPSAISKLPKPTKAQTNEVNNDFKKGIRCTVCGGWHHPKVVHLDYVGHAALTDRLLECDQTWNWEPLSRNEDGSPKMDQFGGMWINLTVCGVTRMGYGHPDGKTGGNAIKEVIGDALRNAAMRFGAALDLWHKGDLHADDSGADEKPETKKDAPDDDAIQHAISAFNNAETRDALASIWGDLPTSVKTQPAVVSAKDARKAELDTPAPTASKPIDDEIPY